MKLATLRDGSRDGQLAVVSRDLATAHFASGIAGRLQQALDDWAFVAPQLADLYQALNEGRSRRYLRIGGRWRDHDHWVALREDWRGLPPPR